MKWFKPLAILILFAGGNGLYALQTPDKTPAAQASGKTPARAADKMPGPVPLSRYQAMIDKSPFAPATAAAPPRRHGRSALVRAGFLHHRAGAVGQRPFCDHLVQGPAATLFAGRGGVVSRHDVDERQLVARDREKQGDLKEGERIRGDRFRRSRPGERSRGPGGRSAATPAPARPLAKSFRQWEPSRSPRGAPPSDPSAAATRPNVPAGAQCGQWTKAGDPSAGHQPPPVLRDGAIAFPGNPRRAA